jgi:hypothetical protein
MWWWGLVGLLKGLCLTLVLLGKTVFSQLFGLFLIMTVYMMGVVTYNPWRYASANFCDRIISTSVLTLVFLALSNASLGGESPESETWAIVLSFAPFPIFLAHVLCFVLESSTSTKSQIHTRYQLLAPFLNKMFQSFAEMPQKDAVNFLEQITSEDRRVLTSSADLLLAELHGQQPRTSRIAQRLIARGTYNISMAKDFHLDQAAPTFSSLGHVKAIISGGAVINTQGQTKDEAW